MNRIIVGYDGRPPSEDAVALGTLLAPPLNARIMLATVGGGPEGTEIAPPDRDLDVCRIEGSSPARALDELVRAEGAVLVVLGSTHRGQLGRIYPGSVAERLLSGGPCAIAVAPRGYAERVTDRLRVIEVGFDGSAESYGALACAVALALAAGATLRIFAVFEAGSDVQGPLAIHARSELDDRLRAAVDEIPDELRPLSRLVDGDAVRVLVSEAEVGVDLLVLGSRSYGPLAAALLGGVSSRVLRGAPCPVLVLPRGRWPGDQALGAPERES